MNNGKVILAIDYSLNGSSIIVGNTWSNDIFYKYFSSLKSDIKNEDCIEIPEGISGTEKLDNLICYFLSLINKVDFVVLESASFNSVNSSTDFQGGYHIIKYLCRRLRIECLEVPPITNKLFFADNGKATKEEMLEVAIKNYQDRVDFNSISKKHRYDVADALSLYELGHTYLTHNRLPAPRGCVGTCDIKPYDTLPPHKKMVIAKLYNREDLYKEAKKGRDKLRGK